MTLFINDILDSLQAGLLVLFVCCVFTIIAALLDMWTALEAVKATGAKPESRPLAKTGIKIVDHIRMILYLAMIDCLGLFCLDFYQLPYLAVVITVGILLREGLSMKENYILKKSHAVEAFDMAEQIVKCISRDDAKKIISAIHERHSEKFKKK